ncbi:MAG: hypothetical protein WCI71_09755 [Bacteroidota bacterium]
MKATKFIQSIILTAVFSLSASFIFAEGSEAKSIANVNDFASFNLTNLSPVTPMEATFEDAVADNDFTNLAPVNPAEATFEDASDVLILNDLAPVTPLEADFEDLL